MFGPSRLGHFSAITCVLLAPDVLAEPADHHTVITPQRRDVAPFESPSQVFTLEGSDLSDPMGLDVPDLLGNLPGVMLQRTNRGAGAPVLRGLIGPENLLLLDGIRLNTSIYRTGPNQYAALIDPRGLRSVELVLGPGSVLYGTDAMGGTINHLMRFAPASGRAMELALDGASADLGFGLSILGEAAFGDLSGSARAGYRQRNTLRTGAGEEVPLSGYDQLDWSTRWRLALADEWAITSALIGTSLTDAGRIDSLGKGDIRLYDNLDHLAYLRLQHRSHNVLRAFTSTLALHAVTDEERRRRCNTLDSGAVADRQGCLEGLDTAIKSLEHREDHVFGLSLGSELNLAPHDLLDLDAGFEFRHEWVGSVRKDAPSSRGNFSDGSTFGSIDGWLWADLRPLWPAPVEGPQDDRIRLKFGGGMRATAIFAHAPKVPGLGDVDYDFTGLVGATKASLLLGTSVHLWAGFSQGFRAPNLQESTVLGDTGSTFEVPNASLRPQRNDTFDVGLRMQSRAARLSAVGFATTVTDAIVREPATFGGAAEVDGKDVFRRTNATRVEYHGLELQLGFGPLEGLSLETSLGLIDGTLTEQDGDLTAPRRLPPLEGHVALHWQSTWQSLRLELGLRYAKAQRKLAADDLKDLRICGDANGTGLLDDCTGTDGWQEVFLGGAMSLSEDLELRLRAENLLDTAYRIHGSGFDAPGFNAELGLGYRFD